MSVESELRALKRDFLDLESRLPDSRAVFVMVARGTPVWHGVGKATKKPCVKGEWRWLCKPTSQEEYVIGHLERLVWRAGELLKNTAGLVAEPIMAIGKNEDRWAAMLERFASLEFGPGGKGYRYVWVDYFASASAMVVTELLNRAMSLPAESNGHSKPERQAKYPRALEFAAELLQADPDISMRQVHRKCRDKYSDVERIPKSWESFRRTYLRHRQNGH